MERLLAACLGLTVCVALVSYLRARRVARERGAASHSNATRVVARTAAALDALCQHASVLADSARDAHSARVVIDVISIPLIDESTLALLLAARNNLAKRGIVLQLADCSRIVAAQLRDKGLAGLAEPHLLPSSQPGGVPAKQVCTPTLPS